MENGSGAMKPGFHDGTTRGSGNGAPTAPFSHAYSPHGNIFAALPGDRNFFLFFFMFLNSATLYLTLFILNISEKRLF